MRKLYALIVSLAVMVGLAASAQTLTVSGSKIIDSTGSKLASGTITFAPVDVHGKPLSYRMGGNGQVLSRPVTATVTNGAFSLSLPDTSLTNPANVCFAASLADNVTGQNVLGAGYSCVQPSSASSASSWCTATTCNFDAYVPNNAALPVTTISGGGTGGGSTYTLPGATSGALGGVQLAPGQSSATLAKVATSGVYADLSGLPTIPSPYTLPGATSGAIGGVQLAAGQSSATLAKVATTGSYNDLTNLPAASGGSASNAVQISTAPLARYDMMPAHVSGTTLQDTSGNGNNASIGGGISSTGTSLYLSNNQQISLPASLNSARSFVFVTYIQALGDNGNNSFPAQTPYILTNTAGTGSGVNLIGDWGIANGNMPSGLMLYGPGWGTICPQPVYGYNTIGITLGTNASTDPDHIYINGVECQNYQQRKASAGTQTSGYLILGGIVGNYYYAEAFSSELSSSDMTSEMNADNAIVAARSVPTGPVPHVQTVPMLMGTGDSIMQGTGSSTGGPATAWLQYLSLTNQASYTVTNYGVASMSMQVLDWGFAYREGVRCRTYSGPAIDIIHAGTNDINANISPSVTFGFLAGTVAQAKAAGCRVFVGTMLSRLNDDANKDAYNNLIRQGWKTLGADGIIDFAADPVLGADGAYSNATYFNGDQTHPTDASYQQHMAPAASNALNYAFGYSDSNPHQIAGSGAYTMTSADGMLEVTSTTAATPLTLPSCIGPSGAVYRVVNSQSTNAVTVVGKSSSQPINGLTTAITVPANGSLALRIVPNPPATSGCHWSY